MALVEGETVSELMIVASGRFDVSAKNGIKGEAGHNTALEESAFFARGHSAVSAVAIRESLVLTLSWDDFLNACRFSRELLEALLLMRPVGTKAFRYHNGAPSRLVLCPAGNGGAPIPDKMVQGLISEFEAHGEVRLLNRDSFGGGLGGAITLGTPEASHWLQEQEQSFDYTLILADGAYDAFNRQAIEEADEIVLIAGGRDVALSQLEQHAFTTRGPNRCRLLLPGSVKRRGRDDEEWRRHRPCASVHDIDSGNDEPFQEACAVMLGKGIAVSAISSGVYAAAILGALQAFEAAGLNIFYYAAAGSAVLPVGLWACGTPRATAPAAFRTLSRPEFWKRASRSDSGLCDAALIDKALIDLLPDVDISELEYPFVAASRSVSTNMGEVHKTGRLRGAVRAGLTPAGILPPLILDDGTILVSGENASQALMEAVQYQTSLPNVLIVPESPPLGFSGTPYSDLVSSGFGRLTPFQSSPQLDPKVRLEAILSAAACMPVPPSGEAYRFTLPIPDGIMPLDWNAWELLRDTAFDFTAAELKALDWSRFGPAPL